MQFFCAGISAIHLSEDNREDLYQRIVIDTRRIKLRFSDLQDRIWNAIDDIQGLVRLVLGMGMLSEDDEEQIRKTPGNICTIVMKYCSFLDFENLEYIVEHKCSSPEKSMMKEYKEEVERFCQRRVSEVPPNSLGNSGNNIIGKKKLYVTLDLSDPALKRIRHLKIFIANILGCRASDLILLNIGTGSVLVTFLLTAAIGARLYLEERILTTEQKAALWEEHVTFLKYESTILFDAISDKDSKQTSMNI